MTPLNLFSSTEFWTSLIVALIGGGGVGAIIGAISSRRKDTADIAAKACDILTDSVIKPLREQVESQEEQIQHLEDQQRNTSRSPHTRGSCSIGCNSSARSSSPISSSGIRNRTCRTSCAPTWRRRPWRTHDLRHRLDRSRHARPVFQSWRPHVTPSTMKPRVKTWGFPFSEKGNECASTSLRGSNESGWR